MSTFYRVFLFLSLLSFLSCDFAKKKNLAGKNANYSIYVLGKTGKEYLIETDSLTGGFLKPEEDGALLDADIMDRDVIVKDGYYYHINRKTKELVQYQLDGGQLVTTAAIQIGNKFIENFLWKSKDSLMLFLLDRPLSKRASYLTVSPKPFQVLDSGYLPIAPPNGQYTFTSIGLSKLSEQHLILGYTYHHMVGATDFTTSDTMYLADIQYPEMGLTAVSKNTRSTYPGGVNTVQPYSFYDEQGDFYFMSCPGIALGNRPDKATAVFKIKKGEEKIDPNYFFDISNSKIQNHGYGIWYIGSGKAIIRTERKDLFTDMNDHWAVPHFEFYVLDLKNKTEQKLDLPLDKGTRRECVIRGKEMVYISINAGEGENFIWLYNPVTGALEKGLQLKGDTDFILRIDRHTDQ